ncbi:hypothetical protein TIFTF001_012555 [Ficus carica]|uniref:Uncharacterized protein n=1 Tax=Ficus carica TaxID=3494 RepID=A0AA88AG56_FICCA|nr:hypothetical protein TIFTF001_012555 [Ficus carica]
MVQPQVPAAPQYPIDIEQQELQCRCGYPPVNSPPAPHDVDSPVEHGQPLLQRRVEGHQPPQCRDLAERGKNVHGRGQDGHIVGLHPGGEGPRAAADVDTQSEHGIRRLGDLEQLGDGQIELGLVGKEIPILPGQIEAQIRVHLVEAVEALATVTIPEQIRVRDGGREGVLGEGGRGGLRRGGGEAAAAGEGVAAAEEEGFGEVIGGGGAEREGGVVHEAVEEVRVGVAGGGDRGELGVEEEIGGRGGGYGRGGGGGGGGVWVAACEVVDGGAYGGELVDQDSVWASFDLRIGEFWIWMFMAVESVSFVWNLK